MTRQIDAGKISVYIPRRRGGQDFVEKLEKIAAYEDRTLSNIAAHALAEYVDRHYPSGTGGKIANGDWIRK